VVDTYIWTEIELCTGANSTSTDLTQREEDEETISDKDKDCSFLCKSETEITSEESTNSDTEKNNILSLTLWSTLIFSLLMSFFSVSELADSSAVISVSDLQRKLQSLSLSDIVSSSSYWAHGAT
jgi:hypothetical protein